MSKVKSSSIPHFELLYIVSNKYTEDELEGVIGNVEKLIKKFEGEITFVEKWGKKKLAYPIDGFSYGYYNLVEFNISGEYANNLNREMKLSNEILRHMVISVPFRTVEEIEKEKLESERIFRESVGGKKVVKKEKKEEVVKDKQEKKEVKKKKEANLKDLDEKLDKILETDDLF